jgi:hypothetical protein
MHRSAFSFRVRTNRFLFLICVATAPALINLPATETASQTAKKPVSNEYQGTTVEDPRMTNDERSPNAQMTKRRSNILFIIRISSFDFDFRHSFPPCEENC